MSFYRCSWLLAMGMAVCFIAGCSSPAPAKRSASQQAKGVSVAKQELGLDPAAQQAAAAHAHFGVGVVQDMNGDTEAALNEYEKAALVDLKNERLVLDVTRRLIQAKQLDRALAILTKATTEPKASGAVYARLGLVYSQLGKYDQAAVADHTAIQRAPDELSGYQNLCLNFLQTKQEMEAIKVLDQAAAQPKPSPEFLIGLAELYVTVALQTPSQKGKLATKSTNLLTRATQQKPTNPAVRLKLADALSSIGEGEKAADIYLSILKNFSDQPLIAERIHAKLADIYLRGSDKKKAAEQLEAVIRNDPTNPLAYYYLGTLAYEDRKPAEAVDYLRKAVLLSPDFEQAYYDLALAQIGADQAGAALATLEQARKKFPQNFVMEFWTGLAYSHEKAYKQALTHLTAAEVIARATEPKRLNQLFYFQLGSASERLGDIPQAEKYFEKSLQLDPNFAECMNYLGYMWAERGTNLSRARELIEKAVKAEPKNPAFLDSLGWVKFKQGQVEEALVDVLKSVELTPDADPTLMDHLGDIYFALKENSKAREAWNKSLALEKNPQVSKKLESLPPP
jgi:tetratricopeptide (TPR) repeat protein